VWIASGAGAALLVGAVLFLRSPDEPTPQAKAAAVSPTPPPPPPPSVPTTKPAAVPEERVAVKPPPSSPSHPPAFPASLRAEGIKAYLDAGGNANVLNGSGRSLLCLLVEKRDAKAVALLLDAGAEADAKPPECDRALAIAADQDLDEIARLLLAKGASMTPETPLGATPVTLRALKRGAKVLKVFLDAGLKPNTVEWNHVLLWHAVSSNNPAAIKVLIEARADVNAKDRYDEATPLHQAAAQGDLDNVKTLVDAGADTNAVSKRGGTPLDDAVVNGHAEVVTFLLSKGAKPSKSSLSSAVRVGKPEVTRALLDQSADINARDAQGATALHAAARTGTADLVKALVAKKADLKAKDNDGLTPFGVAVCAWNREVMKVLVEAGSDVNVACGDPREMEAHHEAMMDSRRTAEERVELMMSDVGDSHLTALHKAVRQKDKEMAAWLLEHGADPEKQLIYGARPLEMAISKGQEDMVELLLSKGAKVTPSSEDREPPLFYVVRKGTPRMAELLLAKGAKIAPPGRNGWTALHEAAAAGRADTAAVLIAKGADVNAHVNDGTRPLHKAAEAGHANVVELLLAKGAKPDYRGGDHKETALSMAVRAKHKAVVEALLKKGADPNIADSDDRRPIEIALRDGQADLAELLRASRAKP
jgi:ankyrin repeat protein